MSIPVLHDIGAVHMTKNNVIQDPGTGGTFKQNGMAYGTATVGAGTYKLPDGGLPMFVQSTGAVYINSVAGVRAGYLASGQLGLFTPLSSTTWAGVRLVTGFDPAVVNAKYSTSSTATTVVPTAAVLTGARHVYWENTADGALGLTTPEAADMRTAIGAAGSVYSYLLTIVNRGNNTITITGGADVSVVGEATIATLVTRTYVVDMLSDGAITLTSVNKGTIET